jgi:hypothetical protein
MGYVETRSIWLARSAARRFSPALLFTLLALLVPPAPALADFGISTFTVTARNSSGSIDERAASHPFSLDVHLAVNTDQKGEPEGTLRQIRTDLPPGLVGNPLATPRCPLPAFQSSPPQCEGAAQIGILHGIVTGLGRITTPIYNLKPLPGSAASFGISVNGEPHVQRLGLTDGGSGSSVRLELPLPSEPAIVDVEEEIWGVPADPAHDPERVCLDSGGNAVEGCSSEAPERPLLTLPASCAAPLRTTLTAVSAGQPPIAAVATAVSRDTGGNPRPLVGCDAVPFDPRLDVKTGAAANTPTSLTVGLEVPPDEGTELAAASLAALHVDLPPGLTLNPAAGSWLTASSWLGSVKLQTPVLEHQLSGSIHLAAPIQNPFASRLAISLLVEDEATGTTMTIPGLLEANPLDGRLSATFTELPQIPFEGFELEFAGGPRAPLAAPPSCGEYSATATLTPSTAPPALPVTRNAHFTLSSGPGSGPCPPAEAERDASPFFKAGTEVAAGGAESPLVIQLAREDTDQHFGSFELTLPPGLVADLGSVPVGAAVGSAQVRAGLGPEPLQLAGTVFLGGPYRGAPYSLAIVVPARAGPFDLGTLTERVAVRVDPATAQLSARADPLPQILAGVPLQLREIALALDRPGFIRNPTSCRATAITGSATTALGRTSPLAAHFRVTNCAGLPFEPKLSLRLSGGLGRNGHPGLVAVLRGDLHEAAVSDLGLELPAGELLDLRHVRGLCGRGMAPERCPARSRLGRLRLRSPSLGEPLEGTVYLRVPSRRLPDLIVELHSSRFRFVLRGRTTTAFGRFGVRFRGIPDVPISEAVLSLPGGRRGIVVNSRSLCAAGPATARFSAHNGKQRRLRVPARLDGRC